MDIILLIFLCSKIAELAGQKNVSKVRWVLTTVLYWILGEIFGIFFMSSVLIYIGSLDVENVQSLKEMNKEMIFIMCAGLLCGYLGYLLTRKRLEDLPDADGTIE